jgi:hypothetical protein
MTRGLFALTGWFGSKFGLTTLPDGSHVLWNQVALPKANRAALAYVAEFLAEEKRSGAIAAAIARTGLTGAAVVP